MDLAFFGSNAGVVICIPLVLKPREVFRDGRSCAYARI